MLSFVATSRNDDHGGDVLRRTQTFINRLAEQCERHRVRAELVLVEWNPPQSRAPLAEVLGWPGGSEWFSARVLTVPRHLHRTHNFSSRLPLFQMIAKNVGIRRALGEHVIATNIDIIFSDELFEWLRRGEFREGALYRSDRWDIPNEIQMEPHLDRLLYRARREAIRRNLRDGTYLKRDGQFANSAQNLFDNRFYDKMRVQLESFRQLLMRSDVPAEELLRQFDEMLSVRLPRFRRNYFIPLLHTNGCGDFTMLAKQDWFRLRGYPEWHIFSWHIDTMLLFQAHYNGLSLIDLDESSVHYHIEHDYGSGWTPEGADKLWMRLEQKGIPYMNYEQYTDVIHELQDNAERGCFTIYNGEDWGLGNYRIGCRQIVVEGGSARPATAVNIMPLDEDAFGDLQPIPFRDSPDKVFRFMHGVTAAFAESNKYAFEVHVETSPEPWIYSVEVDLAWLSERVSAYWLVIEIAVDAGRIGVGLLDTTGSAFIEERYLPASGCGWLELVQEVRCPCEVGRLIVKNATEHGGPARFRLRPLRLFAWDAAGNSGVLEGAADCIEAESPTWPN